MDQGKLSPLAYIDGGDLPNTRQSIFAHIEDGLLKNPHGKAIICMHQKMDYLTGMVDFDDAASPPQSSPSSCLTLSYTQLHQAASKLGAGLLARKVCPGSTLLCLIPNTIEYPLLVWVCALLRLTIAAVDPAVLEDEDQFSAYLKLVKPDVVVLSGTHNAQIADSAIAKQPELWECLRVQTHDVEDAAFPGWTSFRSLVKMGALLPPVLPDRTEDMEGQQNYQDEDVDANLICSILFTSGTSTGKPKGCPLRVGSMTHILESQSWLINPDNCARVLQQAHNARAIAYYHTLQTWRVGGTLVMSTGQSFLVEHTIDAILNHGASFIVLSPAMVHALASEMPSHPGLLTGETSSVRDIQVGGDAVTKEVLVKCAGLFPRARVLINHGMSEGGGFFKWPFFDRSVIDIPYLGEICPVGVVAPGARARVWDAENEVTCPSGQPGELHISADSLIRGYLGEVLTSSFYRDNNGALWMNTGDIGMVTEGGLVYILGRSKDAIRCGGKVIMPATLESCIENFTGAHTCVVAVPRPALGCEPFAVLSTLNGFTEDQIRDHVVEMLGDAYSLGGVVSLAQIGLAAYPISATHKILKLEVQKSVMQLVQAL
ncbi:acetyl-CoA synthetase-like protein [Xylariaceae sp. FL1651]|nr:acetyl-CoA synthetase-like protein [Xylariaceae sp. FL1651]